MQCQRDTSPKIIIDNDAGGDDAMAIFLALLYEKHYNGSKLIGLTTGNGNTNEDNVCRNNQRILKVAKRQDVPIYRGCKESMVITPEAGDYYGKDGLGDSDEVVTGLVDAKELGAVTALIELSKTYEGQLNVITLGTLTNVAMALNLDPNFLNRLSQLYIGAGHIHDEATPDPEFNAQMDVESYHVVMKHATPDKVTVFPFSQTMRYLNFSREWRENVLGAIDTDIVKAQNRYEKVSLQRGDRWQALDPATVAIALNPELVEEYRYSKNDITLCGSQRGINTNEFVNKEDANVRIAYSVKTEKYRQFLLDIFALE
ncbi:probable uridine nucleosidase 2 isoform X2 [Pararge aegeria]|uniref:probable uridine nucleosidase 2 isoform X2 n=1 Tax=Pararge aegeria TaxID=116150 RepID=UPI0019CFFC00|nr:probable uridine nucleosidase 2 isoform X2 [Pararge aegeria]